MPNLRLRLARALDARLLGTYPAVSYRGPFELRSYRRITRIYRDGRFVTNTPNVEVARDLIDSYRKIGRI